MKRIFKISSIFFAILLLFCSCSSNNKPALTIGKGEIGNDVYSYFLDYVIINENKDKKMSEKDIKERATELCLEYTKINTKFDDMNLTLDSSVKAKIANDITNKWTIFGKYYKSIGVSKQTLTKVEESFAFKDAILLATYNTDGTNPIDEESLKKYFKENYVFFKSINGYLKTTDANGKEIIKNDKEITEIKKKFKSMAKSITKDKSIDKVNSSYLQSIGETGPDNLEISFVTKENKNYPNGFFKQAVKMSAGDVKVLTFDSYIFIVQRFDNFDKDQGFYKNYRTTCLKEMVSDDFEKAIDSWYKDTNVTQDTKVQDKCYKQIMDIRAKNKSQE